MFFWFYPRVLGSSIIPLYIFCSYLSLVCTGQPVRLDDRDPNITYSSGWITEGDSDDYLATTTQSNVLGSTMTIPFTGTKISIFGSILPLAYGDAPYALFSLDNDQGFPSVQSQPMFSNNASSDRERAQHQQRFFASPDLPAGPHVLTVTIIDVLSASVSFSFDYAEFEPLNDGGTLLGANGTASTGLEVTPAPVTATLSMTTQTTTQSPTCSAPSQTPESVISVVYRTLNDPGPLVIRQISNPLNTTDPPSPTSSSYPQARGSHILPIVVGSVITFLFISLLVIGLLRSSPRLTTRIRESFLTFDSVPFRSFNPTSSTLPPRNQRTLIPFADRHPVTPPASARLYPPGSTVRTPLYPSTPPPVTPDRISHSQRMLSVTDVEYAGEARNLLSNDAVDDYPAQPPPPYKPHRTL